MKKGEEIRGENQACRRFSDLAFLGEKKRRGLGRVSIFS